jgi:hypothetical protein
MQGNEIETKKKIQEALKSKQIKIKTKKNQL